MTLDCYQCTSMDDWKCMDSELVKSFLVPANCSHVYGALYCVKSIGRYGGFYIKIVFIVECAWVFPPRSFWSWKWLIEMERDNSLIILIKFEILRLKYTKKFTKIHWQIEIHSFKYWFLSIVFNIYNIQS